MKMLKRELGFAHFGNGLCVYDRLHEKGGDYERVAHIAADRSISYYVELSAKDKKTIEDTATNSDPNVSTTQCQKVFRDRPTIKAPSNQGVA